MYDRMDDERIEKLKSLILNGIAEQVFITDTNYNRIKNLFKENENDVQIIQIF
jgi:predicted patatin/cPLA2 family phospholipase